MRTKKRIGLCLCVAVAILLLPQNSIGLGWVWTIPFETLDQGAISYYRYGEEAFAGKEMLITDGCAWAEFWAAHTQGIEPAPPLPSVNFTREMVVVVLLGHQTSGGGPRIEVLEVKWGLGGKLSVLIEDDETPGPYTVITNPYHIVKLRRLPVLSIAFEHEKPL